MKDSVRKRVIALFQTLPDSRELRRLEDEFKEKGFLSKLELKQLFRLEEKDKGEIKHAG